MGKGSSSVGEVTVSGGMTGPSEHERLRRSGVAELTDAQCQDCAVHGGAKAAVSGVSRNGIPRCRTRMLSRRMDKILDPTGYLGEAHPFALHGAPGQVSGGGASPLHLGPWRLEPDARRATRGALPSI